MTNLDAIRGLKNIVMTPNATEFDRLFKAEFEGRVIVTEDTLGAVKLLAAKLQNVTVVRKGPTDIISDGIHVLECAEPCSLRRCGGQGDVLSGVLGTFLHWTKRNSELFVESKKAAILATSGSGLAPACVDVRPQLTFSSIVVIGGQRSHPSQTPFRPKRCSFYSLFLYNLYISLFYSTHLLTHKIHHSAFAYSSSSSTTTTWVGSKENSVHFDHLELLSSLSKNISNLQAITICIYLCVQEEEPTLPVAMDFTEKLPADVCRRVFRYVDLKQRTKAERVSKRWREIVLDTAAHDDRSVWLYVIFREGHLSGHDRMTVRVSYDGPIFWDKSIVYVYLCSCHAYERHEKQLISLFKRIANSVHRLCLVSSPVRSPFLTNDFYTFILDIFKNLQILYLRELNLENVATTTVERLATSKTLSRVVVHDCIHYDSLTDYHRLNNRLMLVKGHLRGLEDLLRSKNAYPEDSEDLPVSTVQNRPESNISNMINGLTIDSSSPVDAA
ncbi:putative F-box domain protein [Trichinella spiralis]|uniref:putative F-box domain protein n=1 Tax=Trichinella spiralis TaxID=6334 RepID=UPI0001EFC3BB|nr:putative F-box domain protein [Trichinella spiralis]